MRVELENNTTSLNEFVAKLTASHKSVELTRGGEVVATITAKVNGHGSNAAREKAANHAKALIEKARGNSRKNHNMSERQLMQEINSVLTEVRKQHVQRSH